MPLSTAASPTASPTGAPESFAHLMEGFRGRFDREIAAFLAVKRRAAQGEGADRADRASGRGAAATLAPDAAGAAGAPGTLAPLSDPSDLVDGIRHLMEQGGKRLRPALVLHTYRACGGRSEEQVLPLALATEFLHTYLLIHDDIMDHAELRRGQPSAHARFRDLHRASGLRGDGDDFGRSAAILLGDLAHTYAVELFTTAVASARPAGMAGAGTAARAQSWRELCRCFSEMCEEVIGGQYLEFLLAHRHASNSADRAGTPAAPAPVPALEPELLRILRLKSGRYTAERPIQLGALLAGAPAAVRAELSRYGTAVGEAFQLQDDLLGVFGDPATVGKPVGDDLREGKFTLLIHHALAAGGPADRAAIVAALGNAELSAAELAAIQEVFERTGARRAVTAMIAERLADARGALDRLAELALLPETAEAHAGRLFLSGLLDYLWGREQ
jgi:geranylgeranyl diphosphate synthase, type I